MDVMFYEVFGEEEKALRRYLPGRIKARFSRRTVQSDGRKTPPSKLISIRTQSIIPQAWVKHLFGILTRSTGFDHLIQLRSSSRRPIPCGYLPSYCTRAVAEHCLLTMLALARKFKRELRQFSSFDRNGITGAECSGRTVLVVGVGRIGSEIIKLTKSVGMRVRGVDLVRRIRSLKYVGLKEGIRAADVIVCALPLTRFTKGMLDYQLLRNVRSGAIFVNIGRGEVSPIDDLRRLLNEGILGGLGLDVYEDEQALAQALRPKRARRSAHKKIILSLGARDNVLLTPHNAFNTKEALERKARQSSAAIVRFLRNGVFPDPIPN